ncbi:hypothetical protein OIE66_21100 [Nonomuraea sp. NBC_01738]|uniref:hypothetical protein n=1 Tax=Nonomuraea sp. NBC_01738 TaxID=2976003 RepID=UPI002E0DC6E7|nr:hypothetical protein OIE66_21100 [Nonomuraea sp. NBC_01738]
MRWLAALALLLIAGCGIQNSDAIDAGPAPSGLGSGPRLFFVKDGRLQSVVRQVEGFDDVTTRLRLLLAGPIDEERDLTTALPAGLRLVSVAPDLITLTGSATVPRLGLQQVACTATYDGRGLRRIKLPSGVVETALCPPWP